MRDINEAIEKNINFEMQVLELRKNEYTVTEISSILHVSSEKVSNAIKSLTEKGLLATKYKNLHGKSMLKRKQRALELLEDGKTVNAESLNTEISNIFGIDIAEFINAHEKDSNTIVEELEKQAIEKYQAKEEEITSEKMRELERVVMLKVVDEKWMNHIDSMDELKNGIGLRAYGQQDPVVKYRTEGMDMFEEMVANIKLDVVKILMNIRKQNGDVKRQEAAKITGAALEAINSVDGGKKINTPEYSQTVVNEGPKIGRNDPCPCGSGKKYKNCCGKNA